MLFTHSNWGAGTYILYSREGASKNNPATVPVETPYIHEEGNELLNDIYVRLDKAYKNNLTSEECQLVASYFAVDYFTLKNKKMVNWWLRLYLSKLAE